MYKMINLFRPVTTIVFLLFGINAFGFELKSSAFKDGGRMKAMHAACKYSSKQKRVVYAKNQSPSLKWRNSPAKTRSFVLVVTDPDVPLNRQYVNVANKIIAKEARRRVVYHWIVTDIPASVRRLRRGAGSLPPINVNKPVEKLKGSWATIVSYGSIVDFSDSYVGPCPPSNDERLHHYIFKLYALDVAAAPKKLSEKQLMNFIAAHTLKVATLMATWDNRVSS